VTGLLRAGYTYQQCLWSILQYHNETGAPPALLAVDCRQSRCLRTSKRARTQSGALRLCVPPSLAPWQHVSAWHWTSHPHSL
jgi:hypothetical protein